MFLRTFLTWSGTVCILYSSCFGHAKEILLFYMSDYNGYFVSPDGSLKFMYAISIEEHGTTCEY